VKDSPNYWDELWQNLIYCLKHGERTWSNQQPVYLQGQDHLLDTRQLQNLAEILEEVGLKLSTVLTSRRQTAVAAATLGYSVEQGTLVSPLTEKEEQISIAEPLYLKTTIRSGVEIRHNGTVIILGDINPGGSIVARGDIIVWGHLRGLAHAGSQGHRESRVFALRMEPTQLRITDVVARVAPLDPNEVEPEIAYLTQEGIGIAKALNFEKIHQFSEAKGIWTEMSTHIPSPLVETSDRFSILTRVLKSPSNP
jgi:septum site-determining protein MinC